VSRLSLRRRETAFDESPDLDADGVLDGGSERHVPIASGAQQAASTWSTKAASAFLLAGLALGPVGAVAGVLALTQPSATVAPTAPVRDRSGERAVVGEYAQRVVVTWLTTTQDNVDVLDTMVDGVQLAPASGEPFTAQDVTVAGITPASEHDPAVAPAADEGAALWSVTVAATVTDARDQTARRFFQVPVMFDGVAVTALTLPAPVAGPVTAPGAAAEYDTHLDPTSPVGQAVAEFLGAYVAGAGDVSRYVTPGVTLTAVDPPPYASVDLVDLRTLVDIDAAAAPADGHQLRVLATASGVVTDAQVSPLAYALMLTARAGRWEITAIDPVPATAPALGATAVPPSTPIP